MEVPAAAEYTIKCTLDKFCKEKKLKELIQEKVLQMHRIVVETTILIGLDLRLRYEEAKEKKESPKEEEWDAKRVEEYIYAVTENKRGKKKFSPWITELREKHYIPLRKAEGLKKLGSSYSLFLLFL